MEKRKTIMIFGAVFVIAYVALLTIGTPKATNTDKTLEQLESFLSSDKTDEHEYSSAFSCFQFSSTLRDNATKSRFKCHEVILGAGPVDHSITLFELTEGFFFVEPQSDKIVNPFIEYPGETFITIWN